MRVGLFTESYAPVINGVSTSVRTLAEELLRLKHRPVIIAPRFPGFALGVSPLPEYADVLLGTGEPEVWRIWSWRTPLNPDNPFAFPPLPFVSPPALRHLEADIIHTQQPFGMGRHGRAQAHRLGVPLVSTFHTLYTEYAHYAWFAPRIVVRRYVVGALRRYYRTCDAIIVPSREAGRRLQQFTDVAAEQLHVVPTGVPDPAPVSPQDAAAVRDAYDIRPDTPLLLFVGRLAPEKNLDLLIDAFADVLRRYDTDNKRPNLLIVGSGPYRAGCERQVARRGVAEHVRFTGYLTRDKLAPIYAAATLFAFPSATETQGVVLSEAQGYGLPCIVVNGGGAPEFVRANVDALVVPSTVPAFANAVHDLLTDDAKREAFAAAACHSPLRPTPAGMASQIVDVYEAAHALCRRTARKPLR